MNMYFLTEFDPRAKIKGSRDPLGLQPIWTSLGRNVVGTLTTVTRSVRNFTTLILGLRFADQLIESGRIPDEERTAAFLRFEQLAAYSRVAEQGADSNSESQSPLGITRVRKRLGEGKTVMISADVEHHILSNQKTYGIWGLYSSAGRNAGLVMPDVARPTHPAREFVERFYTPELPKEVLTFCERGGSFSPFGRHTDLRQRMAKLLAPHLRPAEVGFYAKHLVLGEGGEDATHGRQAQLWRLLERVNAKRFKWNTEFGYAELLGLVAEAKAQEVHDLERGLARIAAAEPLLAGSEWVFDQIRVRDGQTVDAVAAELKQAFEHGFPRLQPAEVERLRDTLSAGLRDGADELLLQAGRLLAEQNLEAVIPVLIALNGQVMKARGGAPWMQLKSGVVHVNHQAEPSRLPGEQDLNEPWVNPYFINSLKALGAAVMGKQA